MAMTKKLVLGLGLFLLVIAAMQGLAFTGWLAKPEYFYQDLWHQAAGLRYPPQHVVIVAVGDATLEEHPDEPLVAWTPYWTRVLQVLQAHGAKAIGLDYLFRVSLESWLKKVNLPAGEAILNYDRPFKEQLAAGNVAVAGRLVEKQGHSLILLPVDEFAAALPDLPGHIGLINLVQDEDGAVRCYVPALEDNAGSVYLTLPYLLAGRWQGLNPRAELARLRNDPRLKIWSGKAEGDEAAFPRIGFAGPPGRLGTPGLPQAPGTFARIPVERLLTPGANQDQQLHETLKGKVVIVTYEPSGSQDMHPTPYALGFWPWEGKYMSGAEIHANVVETILSGKAPRNVPRFVDLGVLAGFLAAGLWLFFRLSSRQGLAALAALAFLAAGLGYGLFLSYLLLPVARVQGALALGYVGVLGLRLTGEERERARLRQMFGRYVSDEVVDKLLADGAKPDLGGEAYRVTVLFSDIRNFTTISESLTPGEVVEMLNRYFTRACEPILAVGGTVDKFVGDAIMAVFGAPATHPDHARRAIAAALDLVAAAREFQGWLGQRFPGLALPQFKIGVGLHTGEAVVGNIGSPKRLEYTAIGDTVNTASRLEGLSKELGWTIVASRATLIAAHPGVVVGDSRTVLVKGRREPVEVCEILGLEATGPEKQPG
uniref:Adenylate/guanylate cyclase domain-containing protein n=1 Tax=Desulfobacca acetoxidans TaxID=60893 RepID=A0A7C3V1E1_9BACT